MRPPLRKKVVTLFQREFEARYPRFSLTEINEPRFKVWGWKAAPELTLFAALQIFRESDEFAAEIAWSKDHEFPWHAFGAMAVEKPRGRERLSMWKPGGGVTWDLAPEVTAHHAWRLDEARRTGEWPPYGPEPIPPMETTIPRIAPAVDDCLSKFEQYALPILNAVAASRGVTDIQWRDAEGI